ncbi:MAG: hypothetical protein Q9221_007854 [Calogaya cf. arnoldii]
MARRPKTSSHTEENDEALRQQYQNLEDYHQKTLKYLKDERAEKQRMVEQMRDLEESLRPERKFAVVLIDANGYKFHSELLNDEVNGGKYTAYDIVNYAKEYMESTIGHPGDIDVVIRA